MNQKACIDISFEQEKPLDECFAFLYHIQNFLSIGVGAPVYPLEIKGRTEAKKYTSDGKDFHEEIQIRRYIDKWKIETKTVHSSRMLFTLTDVQEQLESYLCNWIEKTEDLKPVYDLFFGTIYNPPFFVETRFLNMIQAIEAYHRRRCVGKYQSNQEYRNGLYQKFVAAIPSELKKDFRQSLKKGKLWYANEHSLRKRLGELIDKLTLNIEIWFLDSKENTKDFVERAVETRNCLIHHDPESEAKCKPLVQADKLYELADQLRIILQICLLEEIGFDPETIKKLFRKMKEMMPS